MPTYYLFKILSLKSYFGQSVYILKTSFSATTGTEHPPGSVIPSNGQGFGFLWQKTAKSRAYSFGSITRLAWKKLKISNAKLYLHTNKHISWIDEFVKLSIYCTCANPGAFPAVGPWYDPSRQVRRNLTASSECFTGLILKKRMI